MQLLLRILLFLCDLACWLCTKRESAKFRLDVEKNLARDKESKRK